ncbi:MAG: MFS transporter [Bacteroidetes bacterium]|nr:MFS transporter [Bacteroidota bacterium]
MSLTKNVTKPMTSLSTNTFLRYFNFIALYFAQGVPEGMLAFGIPAWLAMNGKSAGEIASFAVAISLPWSFKFIVAPLMDRYTYLSMGRKRPWVIFGQLGLILSCIYLAYVPDPLNNLHHFMAAGFVVSFFGAFQDVATDGMAVDIIPLNQQARANGFMWGAKTIGISVSLAVGSWIIKEYNYTTAILTLASIIGFIMILPICSRERPGEKIAPWTSGKASLEIKELQIDQWRIIFKSLFKVFTLRNSLLMAILLFMCQGAMKYIATLLPIFTVKELGWTNVTYSQYYAAAKLIGGIVGMVLGGILIERFGKKRMLNVYFLGLIMLTTSFVFFKQYWSNHNFIYTFMIVFNTLYTFTSICLFAIAMQCCWKKVSASQFTLYMTIANLGQISLAAFIGPLKEKFSWQISILVFAVFIAVAWLLLQFIKINKQIEDVAALESKDVESRIVEMPAK